MTERNRPLDPQAKPDDRVDNALRPQRLAELIGQDQVKENLSILIQAALQRKEALDHVLFYGPPGLGKCITADSLIITDQGMQLFHAVIPPTMLSGESRPVDVQIYGLHGLEHTSHIYCSGNTPTLRITTRSGFELEGTYNHPVLVATSDGPQWKPLSALTQNDYVAISRGSKVFGRSQVVYWHPSSPSFRREGTENLVGHLHNALSAVLGRFPSARELTLAYAGGESRNPTPEYTAKRLNLPLSDGRSVGTVIEPWLLVPPPEEQTGREIVLDSDLAYFLGVLVGDGHFEKRSNWPAFEITCGETEMQEELCDIAKRHFGEFPSVHKNANRTAMIRFPQSIGHVMLNLGAKAVNAREKVTPQSVLTGSREVVIGFLQGLFDADGNVWPDGYVEFSSRSRSLVWQVQLLLANIGVIAHRSKKQVHGEAQWSLFVGGDDAEKFHQLIGFRLSRKRIRATGLRIRKRGWSRSDLVPGSNPLISRMFDQSRPHAHRMHKIFDHVKRGDRIPSRRQISYYLSLLPVSVTRMPEYRKLCELTAPAIYWDKVANIIESQAETYDFVVPGTHSFVANGFINHNTTLAHVLANEMGVNIKVTSGPAVERAGDLAAILTNLRAGDVLFIDEIHRLGRAVEEVLYPAMEDFALDIVIGKGPSARSIRLKLPHFTIVGATTRLALVTAPLRARFGAVYRLDYYDEAAMQQIVSRAAGMLKIESDEDGIAEVARRARGTPRVALRLLRRVRDFAQVRGDGTLTRESAAGALDLLQVDLSGLDDVDRRVLRTIIEKYNGGPVGLNTIAAAISEEADTIMDVVEPYLLQLGFLDRTPQGRVATRLAYEHLDLPYNEQTQPKLF
jgi:Holliday junction DNA helicase RuvB